MPVYKSLDEMIKHMMRRIEEEFAEVERDIQRALKPSLTGYERPLYSIIDNGTYYEVVIDLPFVDTKALKVSVVENVMNVEAEGQGRYYKVRLTFPEDVDPKTAEVNKVKNFIRIKIKKRIRASES